MALTFDLVMFAAVVATIAALIIGPALARRQRRLAVILLAAVPVLLGAAALMFVARFGFDQIEVGFTALLITEIAAVLISPDTGRQWRALGRTGLIIVIAVPALTLAAEQLVQSSIMGSVHINRTAVELAILAVGIALILIFGSGAHKRLLALPAIPGYPILAYVQIDSLLFAPADPNALIQALYLPTLAIALFVGLAIWRSSRTGAPGQARSRN